MQENYPVNQEARVVENSSPSFEQPKQNNFLTVLLSILLLISISIAGFFAYQTQKLVKEVRVLNEQLPVKMETPISVSDSIPEWKTYENKDLGFSLKIPSNWDASLVTKTEPFESSVLSISDGEYKLVFNTTTAGYGGIICDFVDSTTDEFAGPGIDNLGDPFNLEGKFGNKLRRNVSEITSLSQYGYQKNEFDYTFRICQSLGYMGSDGKSVYSGTFDTKSGITEIVYYTPMSDIEMNELELLDQILSTFKFSK